jgi:2-oxoglutarate dehydrogenase E2 component (dihydrolipoamide succinyltransferase)
MATDIMVPTLGESVTEATVAQWLKKVGDTVQPDEPLVELETDKVTLEVNATSAGVLSEIRAEPGATVNVGAVLGVIGADGEAAGAKPSTTTAKAPPTGEGPQLRTQPAGKPTEPSIMSPAQMTSEKPSTEQQRQSGPAARKLMAEQGLEAGQVQGTGRDGRVTKGDVLQHGRGQDGAQPAATAKPQATPVAKPAATRQAQPERPKAEREERVRMTRLRQRIAERLKEAQNTAAMLTTFNEVDMSALMGLRNTYKDSFEKKHGVRLGFMSFFVKASIAALKEFPAVNAEIDGAEIVYKNHYDVGVAVSTPNGLVVPVLRDADQLGFAEVEKMIGEMGRRARDGKIGIEELTGGTFTITNGGVFGSLLSTPILNPPQSAILGMHKVQERPVAIGGKVEVRPMMYLAVSYDHRLVDGREAVSFLVRIKEGIEDPHRLMLEV